MAASKTYKQRRLFCVTCDDHSKHLLWDTDPLPPCASCGGQLEDGHFRSESAPAVVQDSIEGGLLMRHGLCNADGTPRRYDSKSEIAAEAKRRGLVNWVEHIPEQGSDKSPHTVRWVSAPPISEEERLRHWHESDPALSAIARLYQTRQNTN